MKKYPLLIVSLGFTLLIISLSYIQCTQAEKSGTSDSGSTTKVNDETDDPVADNAKKMLEEGKQTFRFETFGDEAYWTDGLQLHKTIAGEKNGGIGPGLSPKAALAAGLKVDMDVIPADVAADIKAGKVNLDDPAVTLTLLQLNAVVGVKGTFDNSKNLVQIGITCASCHSTVDDAFAPGIGRRLDGWPNRDLNVGAIVSMAGSLKPLTDALGVDEATVKKVLASWGPGKFDAELNLDGKAFRPDAKSAATLIPEAFGHAGHTLHTWTGGWGDVTYWNAYVANLELNGQGNFYDTRLNDAGKYPVAAKAGFGNKRSKDDRVTDKLAALQFYQLAIPVPKAPDSIYNKEAAQRGMAVFNGKAQCATCHVPPLFTEPGWNTHKPSDIGIDDFQSNRSPDKTYVTQGLKGLWTHMKGGFYHDGRFATLMDVVNHYNDFKKLALTDGEKSDLVEYLKSL
jgi:mono/diheme cytochrome c family protein